MARVTYEHVTKRFGPVVAVSDLDIQVPDKEFLVLVGPSGCGKSTALRLLAGLEEITEGNIYIGDRLVNDVAPKDRDIAMVFQSYALYPHMSVYDNMAFGLKLRKTPKQDIERRVQGAAEILGIEQLLDRKPKALSGGQRQRVALGRAIVREPHVFLMDEPLSNLDAKLRVQMRAEISKLHQRLQTTTIYVTHDQTEAMTMGTRIVVLKDGLLQQVDAPQVLYEKPANVFVAGFIGSPAMNFFYLPEEEGTTRLVGTNEEMYVDTGIFKVRMPPEKAAGLSQYLGQEVIFGIRPEGIADRRYAPDTPDDVCFSVKVDVVELMGNEYYLYLLRDGKSFVARVEYRTVIHPGDELEVALNMDRIHLFDTETQTALT